MADPAEVLDKVPPGYDEDFCLWAEAQGALLRSRQLDELDFDNLADEIEEMSGRDRRAVESNLVVVLKHLLKYRFQPERRSGSWLSTIREHRRRVTRALKDSPSIRRHITAEFDACYDGARRQAADETGLPLATFPGEPVFRLDEALDPDFWPEPTGDGRNGE